MQGATTSAKSNEPPLGYRAYGEKAPRDISANLSEENIIYRTRVRGKKIFFSAAADKYPIEDQDKSNNSVLSAFTAAISAPSPYKRPYRDDLPPKPKNWKELIRYPHYKGFTEAARVKVKGLKDKGTFQEINRPNDISKQVLLLT